MKTSAWLVLEMRETRSYSSSSYSVHITRVRQSRPLNELAVKVTLDIPDDFLMPKVEALIAHQSQIELELVDPEDDEK